MEQIKDAGPGAWEVPDLRGVTAFPDWDTRYKVRLSGFENSDGEPSVVALGHVGESRAVAAMRRYALASLGYSAEELPRTLEGAAERLEHTYFAPTTRAGMFTRYEDVDEDAPGAFPVTRWWL